MQRLLLLPVLVQPIVQMYVCHENKATRFQRCITASVYVEVFRLSFTTSATKSCKHMQFIQQTQNLYIPHEERVAKAYACC